MGKCGTNQALTDHEAVPYNEQLPTELTVCLYSVQTDAGQLSGLRPIWLSTDGGDVLTTQDAAAPVHDWCIEAFGRVVQILMSA